MKQCIKCGEWKELTEFRFREDQNRYRSCCNLCRKEYAKNYRKEHPGINKKVTKKWRKKNKESIKKYNKEYNQSHKEEIAEYDKTYYQTHKEKIAKKDKIYNQTHKKERNKHLRKRRRNDPKFRLNENVSRAISLSLKGNKGSKHWETFVDFTQEELIKHLQNQFTTGMNLSNYGKWHVDHRIPISVFNFDSYTDLDFKRCWALSNLQPMWAKENMSKHNKINKPFQPSLKIKGG